MHFVYFAEQKLEKFYDSLVERTEEKTTKVVLKEGSGHAGVKGKGTLGSILAHLGLAGLEIEANVSASGKLSFSNEVVSAFTPSQKLKALLLKLNSDARITDLNHKTIDLLKVGSPVVFATWIQVDKTKRSPAKIEKTGAAILAGYVESYKIEIQASLKFMESENAWRRIESKRFITGFGTLIGIGSEEHIVEIDPIVFGYAEPE